MSLSGEPKTEVGMRLEGLKGLLQKRQEADDEMQILEANPLALLGSLLDQYQSSLILITSH